MTARRLPPLLAVLLLAVIGLSGCVAIKSESSSTSAPGVVTIHIEICASQRETNSNCIPPNDPRGLTPNTAEGDNGSDAFTGTPQDPIKGQLVAGFRVPTGTVAPDQFTSVTGEQFTKSAGYTDALRTVIPPATGFQWIGYVSSAVTLTGGAPLTTLDLNLGLPSAADGSPFTGPFLWRAIVGEIGVGFDPAKCTAGSSCFDSPQPADLVTHKQQDVSDFRVLPGTGATAAPGQAATVSFAVRYIDNAQPAFGARTFDLTGSSTLPGNPKVTPSATSLTNVTNNQTRTVTASVTVPVGTAPGNYPITLTATDHASGVPRSNTATITVVDKTAPSIRIGSPTDGEKLNRGQRIAADYSCADEPNGSGVAACTGPVPSGAPIDTASVGTKTFTVTATDNAGNSTSLTKTYRVKPKPAPGISVGFTFAPPHKATIFATLQVKGAPRGSTVTAICHSAKRAKCPVKHRFVKRSKGGIVKIRSFLRRRFPAGTQIEVRVTSPGTIGAVRILRIRRNRAPAVAVRCLPPGAKKPKRCG